MNNRTWVENKKKCSLFSNVIEKNKWLWNEFDEDFHLEAFLNKKSSSSKSVMSVNCECFLFCFCYVFFYIFGQLVVELTILMEILLWLRTQTNLWWFTVRASGQLSGVKSSSALLSSHHWWVGKKWASHSEKNVHHYKNSQIWPKKMNKPSVQI